jgi:hypothetical protein
MVMLKETEAWSPDQELQLLEELAEAEAEAFDLEIELPVRVAPAESERPWVAYWHLPPDGIRSKSRAHSRLTRGR